MHKITLPFIIGLCLAASALTAQSTHEVPTDFPTIQLAIQGSQSGDRIEVLPGTYLDGINFIGKDVHLIALEGPESTIIESDVPAVPSFFGGTAVQFVNGETNAAIIEGFSIIGTPSSIIAFDGGGIFCNNASPTIRSCIIENHRGFAGNISNPGQPGGAGGIEVVGGNPIIEDCVIRGCLGGAGGFGPTSTTISTIQPGGAGGISIRGPSSGVTVIRRCRIIGNVGGHNVLGISTLIGGTFAPPLSLGRGGTGGVDISGGAIVEMTDCVIAQNSGANTAFGPGVMIPQGPLGTGGLWCDGIVTVGRVTLADNKSGVLGDLANLSYSGGVYSAASNLPIDSSIVWGNVDANLNPANLNGPPPQVSYSVVEGPLVAGIGNKNGSPAFINPAGVDYAPLPSSSAIDCGNLTSGTPFGRDVLGGPRITGPRVDCGAHELNQNRGSGEDFKMTTQVNFVGDPDFLIKAASPGDLVSVGYSSPQGGFDFSVPVLLAQVFAAATPPTSPTGFPELSVNLPGVIVIFDGNVFGPALLPPQGMQFVFNTPASISGFTARFQALAFSNQALNNIFATSDAFDFLVP